MIPSFVNQFVYLIERYNDHFAIGVVELLQTGKIHRCTYDKIRFLFDHRDSVLDLDHSIDKISESFRKEGEVRLQKNS